LLVLVFPVEVPPLDGPPQPLLLPQPPKPMATAKHNADHIEILIRPPMRLS
jgi:hypothetical protein